MSISRGSVQYKLHPYTEALLSALPTLDIDNRPKRILLKGEISSPINPKPGCRFAVRCPYARESCFTKEPELREIRPGHFVKCDLVESIRA